MNVNRGDKAFQSEQTIEINWELTSEGFLPLFSNSIRFAISIDMMKEVNVLTLPYYIICIVIEYNVERRTQRGLSN